MSQDAHLLDFIVESTSECSDIYLEDIIMMIDGESEEFLKLVRDTILDLHH